MLCVQLSCYSISNRKFETSLKVCRDLLHSMGKVIYPRNIFFSKISETDLFYFLKVVVVVWFIGLVEMYIEPIANRAVLTTDFISMFSQDYWYQRASGTIRRTLDGPDTKWTGYIKWRQTKKNKFAAESFCCNILISQFKINIWWLTEKSGQKNIPGDRNILDLGIQRNLDRFRKTSPEIFEFMREPEKYGLIPLATESFWPDRENSW